jgi:vacuolar protein sorting-associated protein 13A/C
VTYFDDKANTNRARNIRPVYGYEGYATEFNPVDAEGFAMIHFIKNGLLMNDRFVSAYFIIPDVKEPDNKFMLVLTIENFVYMSFKTKKKVFYTLILGLDNIN